MLHGGERDGPKLMAEALYYSPPSAQRVFLPSSPCATSRGRAA